MTPWAGSRQRQPSSPAVASYSFEAIGTAWQIDTPVELSTDLIASISATTDDYDLVYSRFRPDSRVRQAALRPGLLELPASAAELGELYRTLYRLTEGRMTPLVAASLEHLGYDEGYSLRPGPGHLPPPAWSDVLDWQGRRVRTKAPVLLDVGAAGKGQLVDLVAGVLAAAGLRQYTVDASGDLLTAGEQYLRIALEHPYNPTQAIGVLELRDGALCASAANKRAWGEGLHHVLDGATGRPVDKVVATWVRADRAMVADGLATALFFTDHQTLGGAFDFSSVRMFSDGRAEVSPNFEGEVFT
jgi:thiamine biosynthesis lipoprotein